MRGAHWVVRGSLGALGLLVGASSAYAQQAPAEAPGVVGKDVVRLKNGGLLRGTITELLPGESVTIVTSFGRAREVPMDEVEYAGAADRDPAASRPLPAAVAPTTAPAPRAPDAPKPSVTVNSGRAEVHFQSEPPGITFYRATSSAVAWGSGGAALATGYERLCTAPCQVTMQAGTELLALSPAGEAFPSAAGAVSIPGGPSSITGSFDSRSGLRTAGWVVTLGSVIGGGLMMYASFGKKEECTGTAFRHCDQQVDLSIPLLAAGLGTFAVGMPVGLVLAFQPDRPKIVVGPSAPSAALPPRVVALQGRF